MEQTPHGLHNITPPQNDSDDLSDLFNNITNHKRDGKGNTEIKAPALKPIDQSPYAPPDDANHQQPTVVHNFEALAPEYDENATIFETEISDSIPLHCPYCNEHITSDFIFCSNCGALLRQNNIVPCRHCQTPTIPDASYCYHCGNTLSTAPLLTLKIPNRDTEFKLDGSKSTYVVGRTVPQQNNFADIDLGQYGLRKISRQHARITLQDDKWFVEDLNSKAGTRIFNRTLPSNTSIELENDMVIYFADIQLMVEISE